MGNPPNPNPNHPTPLATLTGAKWKYWSEPFGFSNLYATKNIFETIWWKILTIGIVMFWKIKDNVLSLSLVLFCKLQIFADMFLRNLYTPV